MDMELKNTVARLSDIVRNAGNIMLGVSGVESNDDVYEKNGDANYVTVFDLKVQNYIMSEVKSICPDAVFIAEEKENDPIVLQNDHCFILDPIDGTTNFIRNYKQSSISLAMVSNGKPVIGIVYNPYLDELFSATLGGGAFMNGAPISVSDRKLSEAVIGYGTSPYYKDELGKKTFDTAYAVFRNCADLRRTGSAAIDLANVAMGRIDGFFELRLSPWDVAAGCVIVKEAGGLLTDFSGNEIDFSAPSSVVAAPHDLHRELMNVIR